MFYLLSIQTTRFKVLSVAVATAKLRTHDLGINSNNANKIIMKQTRSVN